MGAKFEEIEFKNEPDESTPIDSGNLNAIQNRINGILKNVFGGNIKKEITRISRAIDDGIYMIESDTYKELPFTPNAYTPSWAIILTKTDIDNTLVTNEDITQIVIEGDTKNMWIRHGYIKNSVYEPNAAQYNWQKIETTLSIRTGYERETNIYLEDIKKRVYVKRINGGNLPNNTTKSISTNISGNITPYKIDGMAYREDVNQNFSIPYSNGSSFVWTFFDKSTKSIVVGTNTNRSTQTFYVDFYYTYD